LTRIWRVKFGNNFETRNFIATDVETAADKAIKYAAKQLKADPDLEDEYDITAIELVAEAE
jgi:hypothetical protein